MQTGGCAGLNYFLDKKINFSAAICANDEMATGAISAAREKGLNVPNDVSIFGFDNVVFASYTYPTLSTINYPVRDMGKMAAEVILQRVYKQQRSAIQNIFKPEVVARNSVKVIS
jgi:LacI family transcriptional regulator